MAVKHDVMRKARRMADSADDGMYEDVLFTTGEQLVDRTHTERLHTR